jgi:hypothetical protein
MADTMAIAGLMTSRMTRPCADRKAISQQRALSLHHDATLSGVQRAVDELVWAHSGGLVCGAQWGAPAGHNNGDDNNSASTDTEIGELALALAWRDRVLSFRDQKGRTTLHLAAVANAVGSAAMVRLLVSLGADAAQTCGVGGAPMLHYSVTSGGEDSCEIVRALLHGGASALTLYENMSALELAAGAAEAMVSSQMDVGNNNNNSSSSDIASERDSVQANVNTTLMNAKILLRAARTEAACSSAMVNDDNDDVVRSSSSSTSDEEDSAVTAKCIITDLLSFAPSSSDYVSIIALGRVLNDKLQDRVLPGTRDTGSGEHVSFRDIEPGPSLERQKEAARDKEATFAFDDSKTCAAWLAQGDKEMAKGDFEDAAASFYQAMVGADDDAIQKAQYMLKLAVQAARAEKGLGSLALESSSSEGECYGDEDY